MVCPVSKNIFLAPRTKHRAIYPITINMKIGAVVWKSVGTLFVLFINTGTCKFARLPSRADYKHLRLNEPGLKLAAPLENFNLNDCSAFDVLMATRFHVL